MIKVVLCNYLNYSEVDEFPELAKDVSLSTSILRGAFILLQVIFPLMPTRAPMPDRPALSTVLFDI